MKKSILTFLILIISLSGMPSSGGDSAIKIDSDSGIRSVAVPANSPQTDKAEFSSAMPDYTILLLMAIGLIGLAGMGRKNGA